MFFNELQADMHFIVLKKKNPMMYITLWIIYRNIIMINSKVFGGSSRIRVVGYGEHGNLSIVITTVTALLSIG